jgi:hypothetical protein
VVGVAVAVGVVVAVITPPASPSPHSAATKI